ncbi:MAG TPA: alpha-amylase family glycosyl hydrolase [Chryseosolibacter sp.]|nr:alpha-amylase family glycosyl hydrolase [Chryseosolibacter sp.]
MKNGEYLWWQSGIIYQVYPRSFQDSNGDGVGDLTGIAKRLDYLEKLGVDAIWLSPIYPSPMADFGYDISDYVDIHPLFGNLAEFDRLLEAVHTRGMKLILDFVPNHTSDQHPWFIESRSSRDNPKRDWYLWRDANPNGDVPNNWLAAFGGSAWEWDNKTGQYYYHAFLKEQPDLNWRNPDVQNAMLSNMKFWLERGVDGFRVDVIWHMIKDEQFRDNPENPNYESHMPTCDKVISVYSTDQPEVHDIIRMMRRLLDEYHERMMVGEIYLPVQKLVAYYGVNNSGAHLPFNFQLVTLPWKPSVLALAIAEYERSLPSGGWPNWVLGNHDQSRIASRIGAEQARVAAMMLLTLRGTPTIYYGDEIGMKDVGVPLDQIKDPQGLNMPDKNLSRDPARTPMQWDASLFGGFTEGRPWLPLSRDLQQRNVVFQAADADSMFSLYSKLIQVRNDEPSLSVGDYTHVFADHQLLVFTRHHRDDKFLIILNLTHKPAYFHQQTHDFTGSVIVSTHRDLEGNRVGGTILVGGDEGLLIKVES